MVPLMINPIYALYSGDFLGLSLLQMAQALWRGQRSRQDLRRAGYVPAMCVENSGFPQNYIPRRIHVYIYLHEWLIFMVNVCR